ncbi:hypothetical protein DFJ63DRAFT_333894 [Scheffersomyces coipomensis]|uniref:uncharacterized protein n=1 Tax=Scheffersomyces coipomensis TaxID=1788519 RepID=UPI00315C97D4
MKFLSSLSVSLLTVLSVTSATASTSKKVGLTVYELGSSSSSSSSSSAPVFNQHESLLYLVDKFDISDHFKLGDLHKNEELIKFIDNQHSSDQSQTKPNLMVLVRGSELNEEFITDLIPTFEISGSFKDSYHLIFNKLPKLLKKFTHHQHKQHKHHDKHHDQDSKVIELTNEIKLVSANPEDKASLINHFKFFNDQLIQIWKSFSRGGNNDNGNQIILNSKRNNQLNLINDKMFINELSQLIHLNEVKVDDKDILFVELNSLISISKKIGQDSQTFKFSGKILKDYLKILSTKFNVSIFVPSVSSNYKDSTKFNQNLYKRNYELNKLFSIQKKRESGSGQVFYASEEACEVNTNNCSGHGKCTQNSKSSNNWLCSCSSTFNKEAQKTTVWTGYNCGKQDISAQANLFLWSSVALLAVLIGGIQLLISVGNEPLPGVLDAVAAPKKSL